MIEKRGPGATRVYTAGWKELGQGDRGMGWFVGGREGGRNTVPRV